jgi:4-diphosphocytidyl-2-C-methyl-D-erythritol kinase
MLEKIKIKAPAKLNLFLRVLRKRKDNYHDIRSGVTLINLFDEIEIMKHHSTTVSYIGKFSPKEGFYKDCIIKKTLKYLNVENNFKIKVIIKKNIPVKGGLGSASTNAAALIIALNKLNLVKIRSDYKYYSLLGADIPIFLFKQNCIVTGLGEKIYKQQYPKYFFLLIKPKIDFSTRKMYELLSKKNYFSLESVENNKINMINEDDNGNDFEKIAIEESLKIKEILEHISNLDNCIFSRMTGTGSCCYAAFENLEFAKEAKIQFNKFFPDLWAVIVENNMYNV